MFVEPIINRAKSDTTHNRRQAFRYLRDKRAVTELFGDIAERIGDRPGGYTRVVKLGQRSGDAAEMAIIELVDYNDVKPEGTGKSRKRRTRRSRRRGGSSEAAPAAAVAEAPVEDAAPEAVAEVATEEEDVPAVEAAGEGVADAAEEADEEEAKG